MVLSESGATKRHLPGKRCNAAKRFMGEAARFHARVMKLEPSLLLCVIKQKLLLFYIIPL